MKNNLSKETIGMLGSEQKQGAQKNVDEQVNTTMGMALKLWLKTLVKTVAEFCLKVSIETFLLLTLWNACFSDVYHVTFMKSLALMFIVRILFGNYSININKK